MMHVKPLSSTDAAELERLIDKATDDDLSDGGRYFHDSLDDLTRCRHEEIGEYQRRADGALVEFLWNNRRRFLAMIAASDPQETALPMKLPLDSGPISPSRPHDCECN